MGSQNTKPMTPEDYVKFYNDVKIHFEMLCTDRMRRHAYADPVAHDLAFQVFRVLSGYEQSLEEIAQRDRNILTKAAERFREWARTRIITDQWKIDEGVKAILAPLDKTDKEE